MLKSEENNPLGVSLTIEPALQETYYRNDRKSLQCFPVCPSYGTYPDAVKAVALQKSVGVSAQSNGGDPRVGSKVRHLRLGSFFVVTV